MQPDELAQLLRKISKRNWLLLSIALSLLIYWLDLLAPLQLSFSFYYLAPLGLASWLVADRRIYILALLSAVESTHNFILAFPPIDSLPWWAVPFEFTSKIALFVSFCFITAYARHLLIRNDVHKKMLERLAFHDRLTSLPNRALFFDRLAQAMSLARRNKKQLALLFLDLDGFKDINDRYGHEAGDEMLRITARHLRASIRETDTPARLGGDEFSVILGELNHAEDAAAIAQKIIRNLSTPVFLYNDVECSVGVSIGIAIYPEHASEIDRLLTAADRAMYESKRNGKNTYTFFKQQMLEQSSERSWVSLDEAHVLGVPEIDQQHEELVNMLNRLNDAVKSNASHETLSLMFDDLVAYTDFHFRSEEQLMIENGYPDTDAHKNEHRLLVEESHYLKERLVDGSELLALQSLKDWVLAHIQFMDKKLATYLLRHGTKK